MRVTDLPATEPAARLLDVTAVATFAGVSSRHFLRLVDAGKAPRPIRLGRAVRWDAEQIRRWVDDGCPNVQTQGGRR